MRKVPRALPAAWVERRLGADYGVDLEVEPFHAGRSLGDLLLLQVKGVDRDLPADEPWNFAMRTKGIVYAERFVVPVLLAVCPVNATTDSFRFLWLQEYASVVLDDTNPEWRSQGSVTLTLPARNTMPDDANKQRLLYIAAHPRRQRDLARLAHLAHEYKFEASGWFEEQDPNQLQRMNHLLQAALQLDSLFGPYGWPWSRMMAACNLLALNS